MLRNISKAAFSVKRQKPSCSHTSVASSPMFQPKAAVIDLPYIHKSPFGETYVVNRARPEDIDEFYEISLKYSAAGVGFSSHEFPTKEIFAKPYNDENVYWITVTEESTNTLLGILSPFPSRVNRSIHAVTSGAFLLLVPGKQGRGAIAAQVVLDIVTKMGYYGLTFRVAINNMPMFLMSRKKFDGISLGVIPYTMNVPGSGWIDDFIVYHSISRPENTNEEKYKDPVIMATPALDDIKPDNWEIPFGSYAKEMSNGMKVRIRSADLSQKLETEKMLQELAKQGSHVGLDEFTEDGLFNRKFFKQSITLVAETADGDISGAAIIGPCSLNREPESCILHAYAFAPQNQELEKELYRSVHKIAKNHKMLGVVTDQYLSDANNIQSLKELGFYPTGNLPLCGFLQNNGYTDSLIMFLPTFKSFL